MGKTGAVVPICATDRWLAIERAVCDVDGGAVIDAEGEAWVEI